MSLGLSHYRGPHDTLPISDNNVSTTNDALEAGDWEVPESEAELDVSVTQWSQKYFNCEANWFSQAACDVGVTLL